MSNRSDNFDRANGSGLGTPSDSGTSWSELVGVWGIYSNQGVVYTDAGYNAAVLEASQADGTLQVTYTGFGGSAVGLTFRASDANNMLIVHNYSNVMHLDQIVSGVQTEIGSGAWTLNTGDVISAVLAGNQITIKVNGTTVVGPITSTVNQTATKHGLLIYGYSVTAFLDDFSFVGSGGVDTNPPVVASASVDSAGTTLTVGFTEAESPPVLPASGVTGFTFKVNGTTRSLSSIAISGTTLTATIGSTVYYGDTVTLDYAPGNVTDSAAGTPNALATFTGTSVTNNGTQTPPLVAGVASFVSSGPAVINLTATDATGGTPSYTYQWKRSVDGGSYSNLSNGSGVSGATTRTLVDGSATSSHLYGYELVYTDSAGTPVVVTSNIRTASVYSGGPVSNSSVHKSRPRVRDR